MKTFPTLLLAAALGCTGFASGYWAGHRLPASGSAPATKSPKNVRGVFRAILIAGSADEKVDWHTLLKSTNAVDPNLLKAWARNLSVADITATLQDLRMEPPNQRRDDLMGALYDAWAEQEPKSFLATASEISIPRLRENGINSALKTWAQDDPTSALQWVKDHPGTASAAAERERYAAAIAGYAENDPLAAVAAVGALSDTNPRERDLKSAATKALADALAEQGRFIQAASFFGHLPEGSTRDEAYAQLAKRWSESAPLDAASWVESLRDEPQLKSAMGVEIAKTWAGFDPAAAASWAAKIELTPPSVDSPTANATDGQLLATAVRAWTDYDLDSVGEFLNQLPNSAAKDPSVAIFALRASQESPEEVFPWVNTISDEPLRLRITAAVALQWMQQDQAGFKKFLADNTVLSESQKEMLVNMPPEALASMSQFNSLLGGGDSAQKLLESSIIKDRDGVNRNVQPPQN